MLLWWLWLLVQKDSLQHMPRLALLASVALGAIAAFLFANRWLSVMGDDETRQTLAALAALPFMAALWVHQMYPAPGRAVGKEAPSLGPVDLVAEAELPLTEAGAPLHGHAYCICFWDSSTLASRQILPRMDALCRASSSSMMHFVMVSPEKRDDAASHQALNKLATTVLHKKQKLTVAFAADVTGDALENYMLQHGEHGVPHAFIVGADGVIAWHGHPKRVEIVGHLRDAMRSLPKKRQPEEQQQRKSIAAKKDE